MLKKTVLFLSVFGMLSGLSAADGKTYVSYKDLNLSGGKIRLRVGANEWIQSKSLLKDDRGIYILDENIVWNEKGEWVKEWECPYCHQHWLMGQRCKNPECPRNFTGDVSCG